MRGTSRSWLTTMLTGLLWLSLGSCANGEGSEPPSLAPLTPRNSTSTASPTVTSGMSDEQQAQAIYLAYSQRYSKAETLTKSHRRRYLSQWLVNPALGNRVEGIEEFRAKGYHSSGVAQPDIRGIKIDGARGTIRDCSDEGQILVRDRADRIVRRGQEGVWNVVTLQQTEAGWRISEVAVGREACSS